MSQISNYMKSLLKLIIVLASVSQISQAQTLNNSNYFELIESPKIPHVSQITIDYTNIFETPSTTIEHFLYNWSQNNTHVSFEDLWNNYEASFDSQNNVTFYKATYKKYPYSISFFDNYEYDSSNRVIQKETPNSSITKAFYTGTPTDSVISWHYENVCNAWYKTDKIEVTHSNDYFDKAYYSYSNDIQSYIYKFTTRYYLDDKKRVIQIKDLDSTAGSIYNFVYTDAGYDMYITYYGDSHAIFKYEYTFNEQGDITTEYYYEWMNNSYWRPCIIYKNQYTYINSSINRINQDTNYSVKGNILTINTDECATVYSIDGSIIYHGAEAETTINLSNNQFVILRIADAVYKIAIH